MLQVIVIEGYRTSTIRLTFFRMFQPADFESDLFVPKPVHPDVDLVRINSIATRFNINKEDLLKTPFHQLILCLYVHNRISQCLFLSKS